MESPEGWDLLISSLAVCDLQKPAAVWAFLALQGLVRNEPADRIAFFKIVHKVRTQSPSTNSSRARRIAGRLRLKGLALPVSDTPDPHGRIALERRHLMDMWAKSYMHCEPKAAGDFVLRPANELTQEMFTLCNSCFSVYKIGEPHLCPEPVEDRRTTQCAVQVYCGVCKAANRPEARFCRSCGTHFTEQFNLIAG